MILPFQIYRHFKGGLYIVLAVALSEDAYTPTVVYMSLNGDSKVWTRSQSDFMSPVPEGRENPTGQANRFELVTDVKNVLSNCTTQNLIEELRSRPDNPFNEVDFKGFNDQVVLREYALGEIKEAETIAYGNQKYIETIMTADSIEEVKKFMERNPHRLSSRVKIYKSVIVEMESFD